MVPEVLIADFKAKRLPSFFRCVTVCLPNFSFSFTMVELFKECDCYHSTSPHSLKKRGLRSEGDSAQAA